VTPSALNVTAVDDPQWLGLLESHPDATLFHHPSWSRLLTESYGGRASVLLQTDADGQAVAGMPLVAVHKPFTRRRFVSLPFTDYSPPLATSAANLDLLTSNLLGWQRTVGARQIAVHGALPGLPGVHSVVRGYRHVLALDRGSDRLFEGLKGSPVHRATRKARREGITTSISASRADLGPFYRLHLQTRRRLGVPVQPRRFLATMWRELVMGGLGFVVFAYKDSRAIAAALFLAWNGNLIYKFGASDPRYWELRPNNLVMWTAIEWACQQGYRQLDFGRTDLDNPGLREFKRRWGSTEVPLVYSYAGTAPSESTARIPMAALARLIRSSPPVVCRAMGELLYGRAPGSFA
jgi:CelD/BcsL family acetyltransferase involved in cellulose biosynthesis